jgi:hypothetical protein
VRKHTAESLYLKLLAFEDLVPEPAYESLLEDITVTVWDAPLEQTRESRERVAQSLGIEAPLVKPAAAAPLKARADEMESYESLVREAGY